MVRLDLGRIRAAVALIDPVFLDSPQYESPPLNEVLGCAMVLKVETQNPVRSFKGRGTDTVMAALVGQGYNAAVCASAGNLGLSLVRSGARYGVPVTVFAAETANPMKVEMMRSAGAIVHLEGEDIERPRELASSHAEATGAYLVEDSLDLGTCEGAATIGLELAAGTPTLDVVLVALGGGALASGVGHAIHELSPGTKVIAVQPVGAPAMALSWQQRTVVTTGATDRRRRRWPIPHPGGARRPAAGGRRRRARP